MSKRSRSELDAPRTSKQRLYLIFDDWELGYSIRKLNLSNEAALQRHLPPPFIRLEAMPGYPKFFAAIGTKILAAHPRHQFGNACSDPAFYPGCVLPIFDVRSRGVNFAPEGMYPQDPIFLPVGDKLFALDIGTFKMLSMKSLWPPRQEYDYQGQICEWSWVELPMPEFQRTDVTSYAVDSDENTILFSTADATFRFDTRRHEWKKCFQPLPFSGHANFVDFDGLKVLVGLPKDVAYDGHLCFCKLTSEHNHMFMWHSNENLSSKDPAENRVGTTLVYLGETRFCLLECVRNEEDAKAVQKILEKCEELEKCEQQKLLEKIKELEKCEEELAQTNQWEAEEEAYHGRVQEEAYLGSGCYRLTTFSLSLGMNGDLMAAKTAVQCYKVPLKASYNVDPVAFWL